MAENLKRGCPNKENGNKYIKTIYFCLGLGATSPLLAFVIGGRAISLMTIALILVMIDLFLTKNKTIKLLRNNQLYTLYMIWMLISILASFFGFVYFANNTIDYSISSISHIPKIILYILLIILLINNKHKQRKVTYLIKGLAFGIALNIVWSIVDACMYYTIHKSLTNTVFSAYIKATDMHFGIASIVDGFTIRSVGLNNDPATIGFFATVGTAFGYASKRKWIIFICLLACLACISFVGLVGICIVIIYQYFQENKRIDIRQTLLITFALLIVSVFFYSLPEDNMINTMKSAMEMRAESKVEGDHSSETRLLFIRKFPNAILHMPVALILGTGYSTAVYPYFKEGLDYESDEHPTCMENTYIDNFFSFGLIGFIFFCLFYCKILYFSRTFIKKKNNCFDVEVLYSISLGSLVSYAFYHYTLYSVIMLASVAAISFFQGGQKLVSVEYRKVYFKK